MDLAVFFGSFTFYDDDDDPSQLFFDGLSIYKNKQPNKWMKSMKSSLIELLECIVH